MSSHMHQHRQDDGEPLAGRRDVAAALRSFARLDQQSDLWRLLTLQFVHHVQHGLVADAAVAGDEDGLLRMARLRGP